MYLDLMDEIHVNKKLIRVVGIETAVYWSELVSVLKQVVKKQTCDEKGFFTLDRAYVERETSLSPAKQGECEKILVNFGVIAIDPENPDRIAVSVQNMVEVITDEDTKKLKALAKPGRTKGSKESKLEGMKYNFRSAVVEEDLEVREAFYRWVDSMVDAQNCRMTKAVTELFVSTVRAFTTDKKARLRIIEIATLNCYKDATWAINKFKREQIPYAPKPQSSLEPTMVYSPPMTFTGLSDESF